MYGYSPSERNKRCLFAMTSPARGLDGTLTGDFPAQARIRAGRPRGVYNKYRRKKKHEGRDLERLIRRTAGTLGLRSAEARDLAAATTVLLDFEGVPDQQPVGSFYDGVGGPDYGIVFGPATLYGPGAEGLLGIANAPSPTTVLWFLFDAIMTVEHGFTGLSFMYAGNENSRITVYGGPNATGAVLADEILPPTDPCESTCGDPYKGTGLWVSYSLLQWDGIAHSVRFSFFSASVPLLDDMTIALVPPPTAAPTDDPTERPTSAPTTTAPTNDPSESPTSVPTKSPTALPSCNVPTYWVYNADTNAPIRRLANNSATCLQHPYNVEVRPCREEGLPQLPVTLKLVRTANRRRVVVHSQVDATAPFFLFGDSPGTGDSVRPSPSQLPNGNYQLASSVGDKVLFTQACPCPKGRKGKKGCMKN